MDSQEERLVSIEPATGATMGSVARMAADEVSSCVQRARVAQRRWAQLSMVARAEYLWRFRSVLVQAADEVVDTITRECGKPRVEALLHEVAVSLELCDFYAKHSESILRPEARSSRLLRHRRSRLHWRPRGVVAVISPWNYPWVIAAGDVLAALVAGNAVILKPSELTPFVAAKLVELWRRCDLPEDLLQVIYGGPAQGAALSDANPDLVVFTGSVANGRRIAAACGERLIPCTLELGGKAPAIVCADADLQRTARALVWGGMANSGQLCIGVERVFAARAVYEPLLEHMQQVVEALRQGDPSCENTDIGCMINEAQAEHVDELVRHALDEGAQLLCGGERSPLGANFYTPTLLAGCTASMRVMRDEIFGPVVPVMPFDNEQDALRLANDSGLGLAGYVFSRDRRRANELAGRLEVGAAMVNDVLALYGTVEAPFGGVKQSGIGRVHGKEGLRKMCHLQHVSEERWHLPQVPWMFPYRASVYAWSMRTLRYLYPASQVWRRMRSLF